MNSIILNSIEIIDFKKESFFRDNIKETLSYKKINKIPSNSEDSMNIHNTLNIDSKIEKKKANQQEVNYNTIKIQKIFTDFAHDIYSSFISLTETKFYNVVSNFNLDLIKEPLKFNLPNPENGQVKEIIRKDKENVEDKNRKIPFNLIMHSLEINLPLLSHKLLQDNFPIVSFFFFIFIVV